MNFRIISYNPKTYEIKVLEYFKTEKEAEKKLKQMAKSKKCKKHLYYFIQSLQKIPVKDMNDRLEYLKQIDISVGR